MPTKKASKKKVVKKAAKKSPAKKSVKPQPVPADMLLVKRELASKLLDFSQEMMGVIVDDQQDLTDEEVAQAINAVREAMGLASLSQEDFGWSLVIDADDDDESADQTAVDTALGKALFGGDKRFLPDDTHDDDLPEEPRDLAYPD